MKFTAGEILDHSIHAPPEDCSLDNDNYRAYIGQAPIIGKIASLIEIPPYSKLYPTLIVVLVSTNVSAYAGLKSRQFICHATLFDSDGIECLGSHDSQDRKPQRSAKGTIPDMDKYHVTVVGQRTVVGEVLRDPVDGRNKVYFIFNNISVRVTGRYRWKCVAINMDPLAIAIGAQHYECISDTFIVYSRRLFPSHATIALTQLERSLMLQGTCV